MPQPSLEIIIAVSTKTDAILAMFEDYSGGSVSRESIIIDWLKRWSHNRELPETDEASLATEMTVVIDEHLGQCLHYHATWAGIEPGTLASKIVNDRGGHLYDSRGTTQLL